MIRIDPQATWERIHGRPARNGDEVDAFARDRSQDSYRPGERPAIKARHNRVVRRTVRTELGQLARLGG
jgi:hypothetical protein